MMHKLKTFFENYISPIYTTPFDTVIFSTRDEFIKNKAKWSIFKRRLQRDLILFATQQFKYWQENISPPPKKILWLINDRPIGDFLMEIGARSLFRNTKHEIHVFADEHFRELFVDDDIVKKFIFDPAELKNQNYDLILLHSFTQRILKNKLKYFRKIPFVVTNGYFIGPFFNESLLSHYKVAQLLGAKLTADEAQQMASPYVLLNREQLNKFAFITSLKNPIAIALGGKWPWKTYQHWAQVLQLLSDSGIEINIFLMGSNNGQNFAEEILEKSYGNNIKLHNYVAKISLAETACILTHCKLVTCVDGGLFHLANAVGTPTVSLFSQYVDPLMKLTQANNSIAFHSPHNASEVPPAQIAEAILLGLEKGIKGINIVKDSSID